MVSRIRYALDQVDYWRKQAEYELTRLECDVEKLAKKPAKQEYSYGGCTQKPILEDNTVIDRKIATAKENLAEHELKVKKCQEEAQQLIDAGMDVSEANKLVVMRNYKEDKKPNNLLMFSDDDDTFDDELTMKDDAISTIYNGKRE